MPPYWSNYFIDYFFHSGDRFEAQRTNNVSFKNSATSKFVREQWFFCRQQMQYWREYFQYQFVEPHLLYHALQFVALTLLQCRLRKKISTFKVSGLTLRKWLLTLNQLIMLFKPVAVLLLIVSLSITMSVGQTQEIDSLRTALSQNLHDSTRIQVFVNMAYAFRSINPDSTIALGERAITLIEETKIDKYLSSALRRMALAYLMKGDTQAGARYARLAIRVNHSLKVAFFKTELASSFSVLGSVFQEQGNYDSALHYYNIASAIYVEVGHKEGEFMQNNNRASCYAYMGNYPLSLKYFLKSLDRKDSSDVALVMGNIGNLYLAMNDLVKAKEYLLKTLVLYEKSDGDKVSEAFANASLGKVLSSLGKRDSALHYLTRSLVLNESIDNKYGIAESHHYFGIHHKNNMEWSKVVKEEETAISIYSQADVQFGVAESTLGLTEAYFKLGNLNKALNFANQGMELSHRIKAKDLQKGYLQLLSDIHAAQKNFPLAYSFSQQLSVLKDSINNEEKIKQVANMEALYENDKKEKELALSRAEKNTADALLEKQKSRTTLFVALLAGSLGILMLGLFFYRSLQKNRKLLETKNVELLSLNQTKDRFFAIIGHDLRGPITSFSGINDLLNWYIAKNDMAQLKTFGIKITQSVRQLDTLLNNLLNWAMSQTDAVPYKPEPLQLSQLTKECYGYFEHALEVKNISLTDGIDDGITVHADKNALATVIRNLVSNAIKFTPAHGRITISAKAGEGHVWVSVADTGVGLSEEKLKTVFELSETKSTSGTSGEKGSGLGLVLCKDYVALNKGTIGAQSKEGEGTVFRFSVPMWVAQ
jgi:two-component system, NtrC family, sensor kinase